MRRFIIQWSNPLLQELEKIKLRVKKIKLNYISSGSSNKLVKSAVALDLLISTWLKFHVNQRNLYYLTLHD